MELPNYYLLIIIAKLRVYVKWLKNPVANNDDDKTLTWGVVIQ